MTPQDAMAPWREMGHVFARRDDGALQCLNCPCVRVPQAFADAYVNRTAIEMRKLAIGSGPCPGNKEGSFRNIEIGEIRDDTICLANPPDTLAWDVNYVLGVRGKGIGYVVEIDWRIGCLRVASCARGMPAVPAGWAKGDSVVEVHFS